jgi:DNA-binding MarR family transcriptional regulator
VSNVASAFTQLTVDEKSLLHLSQFLFSRDEEAPREATQEGIAEAVGISTTHVPRSVSALRKKGLVEELKLPVSGVDRRRKVYRPTEEGYRRAQEIKRRLLDAEIAVRERDGNMRMARLKDLYGPTVPAAQVLEVLKQAEAMPLLDLKEKPAAIVPSPPVLGSIYSRIPAVKDFVGRKEELKELQQALKDPKVRLIAVTGIAGIGKTTLVARALSREKRDKLFWYRLHEWETLRNLGFVMGDFLAQLGRGEFREYMQGRTEHDVAEAYEIVQKALEGLEAILVLDDFDKAPRNIVGFIRTFLPHMDRFEGMKLIVITRATIPFFSERDRLEGRVVEITLGGLAEDDATRLLDAKRDDPRAKELTRLTEGHPLLLKLVSSLDLEDGELPDQIVRLDGLNRFVSEEILAALAANERRALEAMSVHRSPVPPEAVFVGEDIDFDTIDSLRRKQLVRSVGARYVEPVDFLREFVYHRLKPDEKKNAHLAAAQALRGMKSPGAGREVPRHLLLAGEPAEAGRACLEVAPRYLKQGRTEELSAILRDLLDAVGDMPGDVAKGLLELRAELYERVGEAERAAEWRKRAARAERGSTLRRLTMRDH